jgi:chromosome partitioning protein
MPNRHKLPAEWNNEAYVSLHLVQAILTQANVAQRGWHPEFKIKEAAGHVYADFYVQDIDRNIEFLIEVKSAKNPIDSAARFQLQSSYLFHSKIRYGFLIDPFAVEIYEFAHGTACLKAQCAIENPTYIQPVATFVKNFLDTLTMRTITINASKGGVGKTTLTVNLAYELAKQGQRVLVIDLDDQANASLTLGVNKAEAFEQADETTYMQLIESFEQRKEVMDFISIGYKDVDLSIYRQCIYPATGAFDLAKDESSTGKIDVLPSSYKTNYKKMPDNPSAPRFLSHGLKKLAGDYDYVLIDTAPCFNHVTWSGWYAAKYVLIPTQLEYLSAFGVKNVLQNLKEVNLDTDGKQANVLGIVPMMVSANTTLHTTVAKFMKKNISDFRMLPPVRDSVYFGHASFRRKPLSLYAIQDNSAANSVAQQVVDLTKRIVELIEEKDKS